MPKWKVTTEFTFDSAHFIKNYDGPCGRMPGHPYAQMSAKYINDETKRRLPSGGALECGSLRNTKF